MTLPVLQGGECQAHSGQWILSPAFDINPSPERLRELKTAIADQSQPYASLSLLLDHAFYFDMDLDQAARSMQKIMAHTIAEQWQHQARQAGMSSSEIQAYRDAFQHEESSEILRRKFLPPSIRQTEPSGRG